MAVQSKFADKDFLGFRDYTNRIVGKQKRESGRLFRRAEDSFDGLKSNLKSYFPKNDIYFFGKLSDLLFL